MNLTMVCSAVATLAHVKGLRQLAREWDVDPSYISRVARGEQEPGAAILDNLGLVKVVSYRKRNSKG